MNAIPGIPVLGEVSTWLYVGACVVLPLAWGLATEFVFRRLGLRRKRRKHSKDEHFFIDYHI